MQLTSLSKIFGCCFLISASSAYAKESVEISWKNIIEIYKSRYVKYSPSRNSHKINELTKTQTQGFILDPTIDVNFSKNLSPINAANLPENAPKPQTYQLDFTIKQFFNFGTALSYSNNNITNDNSVESVSVTQSILRNGLIYPLIKYDMADTQYKLDEIRALKEFEDNLLTFLNLFIDVSLAERSLVIAQNAYNSSLKEVSTTQSQIDSGHKAKSDLLVFQAAETRNNQALNQANFNAIQKKSELLQAIWYNLDEVNLVIKDSNFPEYLLNNNSLIKNNNEFIAIQIAKYENELARIQEKSALKDSLPTLDVGYKYSQTNMTNETSKQLTVSLSYPLVSGVMQNSNTIASINYLKSLSSFKEAQISQNKNNDNLAKRQILMQANLASSVKLYNLLQQTFDIAKQKYADGKSTIFELGQTQEQAESAKLVVEQAKADLLKLKLEIFLNNGTLAKTKLYE